MTSAIEREASGSAILDEERGGLEIYAPRSDRFGQSANNGTYA
jgi:hypothetical protein